MNTHNGAGADLSRSGKIGGWHGRLGSGTKGSVQPVEKIPVKLHRQGTQVTALFDVSKVYRKSIKVKVERNSIVLKAIPKENSIQFDPRGLDKPFSRTVFRRLTIAYPLAAEAAKVSYRKGILSVSTQIDASTSTDEDVSSPMDIGGGPLPGPDSGSRRPRPRPRPRGTGGPLPGPDSGSQLPQRQ